jgi:hypothetical protein
LTLPDAGGTVVSDTAPQTLTNNDIVATQLTGNVAAARITTALNASGSAPLYACRAWVNFNGSGGASIRASGNVSSVSRSSTGQYTVNFTTAMPDANYSVVCTGKGDPSGNRYTGLLSVPTTTSCAVFSHYHADFSFQDTDVMCVAVFR